SETRASWSFLPLIEREDDVCKDLEDGPAQATEYQHQWAVGDSRVRTDTTHRPGRLFQLLSSALSHICVHPESQLFHSVLLLGRPQLWLNPTEASLGRP